MNGMVIQFYNFTLFLRMSVMLNGLCTCISIPMTNFLPLSYLNHIFLLLRYKSMDVKNILMESILHHILPQMLVSPLWTELNNLLKDYLKFMDDHFRESADLTFLAYRHRNYSKVCIPDAYNF